MSPYHEILKSLVDDEVDFIVGGGVACVLHGVERVTMDVDLAVHMQPANFNRFVAVMETLGLRSRVPVRPQALLDPAFVRMLIDEKHALVFTFVDPDKPYRQVDVFLTVDLAYESLLPDSEWVELGGYRVRIVNRSRLLAIKRAIVPPRIRACLGLNSDRRHGPAGKAWSTAGPALRDTAWPAGPPPHLAPWPSPTPRYRRTEFKPRPTLKDKLDIEFLSRHET
jgi:hypothetical protein